MQFFRREISVFAEPNFIKPCYIFRDNMFASSSMVIMQPLANLNRTTVKTIIALNNKALFHIGLKSSKNI